MSRSRRLSAIPTRATAAAVAGALLLVACDRQAVDPANDPNLFEVAPRDLQITIKEDAELQAVRETVVRSELEGGATIIYLIEEGAIVEEDTVLAKLDVSDLEDKRANQAISVRKAETSRDQAEKNLEILEKELTTRRNTAQGNLTIAELDLDKFLGRNPGPTPPGQKAQGKNRDMVSKLEEIVAGETLDAAAVETPAAAAETSAPGAVAAGPRAAPGAEGDPPAAAPQIVSSIDPSRYRPLVSKVVELLAPPPPPPIEPARRPAPGADPEDPLAGGIGQVPAAAADVDPLDRDMGDMANRVLLQVDQIRLAMADMKYQEAWLGHSLRLANKGYLTANDLEKDKIEYQRRLSKVGLAWNDLDLLISYELQKDRIKLIQDVANATLELQRVEASNDAERLRARTDLDSTVDEYELAKERLDNLDTQIRNAEIRAPTPGLVIYARTERGRRDSEAIREGISIRERQELIILPDTTQMQAVVKVQEAVVSQVREGQPALIKAEAHADRVFTGRVTRVAQQADSNGGWMSSDRKVYTTVVVIDGDNSGGDLRSRMAAEVTILVDELDDVLAVPLQCVRRDRRVNYVWKFTPQGPAAVPVDVGRHNAEHVAIESGIAAGDRVYLAPPVGAQPPNLPQPEVAMPELDAEPAPAAAAPGAAEPGNGGGAEAGEGPLADGERPGRRGGRREGPGRGPGGNGGMSLTDEQRAQMAEMNGLREQVAAFLRERFPDRAAEVDDRRAQRAMLQEPEVRAALESGLGDVWQRYDQAMQAMRERFGNRRGEGDARGGDGESRRGRRGGNDGGGGGGD